MHYLVKQLVPPIFHTIRWFSFKYGWKGNFASFEEAKQQAGGYDADHILQSIIKSTGKVRDGLVPFERDGIEYDTIKMNFPLLSTLLMLASQNDNQLTVLDFGGSLGTSYFQNRSFLKGLSRLDWCVVEQENYVKAGKELFESEQLHFYLTIEDCLKKQQPDIIIFNSVIQYIESPFQLLEQVAQTGIKYLLFDATAYIDGETDRFTIQHVPPEFYGLDASYACIFFSKSKMFNFLKEYYHLCFEFISEPDKYYLELMPFQYKGQLWQLK
jgi:putative methyltransferase (TIGR04325 family)